MSLGGAEPQLLPVFVETTDSLGHLWIGIGVVSLLFLGRLVQCIHVGLLGSHLLLKGLHVCVYMYTNGCSQQQLLEQEH